MNKNKPGFYRNVTIVFLMTIFVSGSIFAKSQEVVESSRPSKPMIIGQRIEKQIDIITERGMEVAEFEIYEPGASFIKVHFSQFRVPPGLIIEVASPDGRESYRYTRGGGEARTMNRKAGDDGRSGFSAMSISGDTAIVKVLGKPGQVNSLKNRVHIDYYMSGYPEDRLAAAGDGTATVNSTLKASGPGVSQTQSICGLDERYPAACWEQSHPEEFDQSWPVARLLINGSKSCTAWRVGPGNVLFTNNHCIATQEALETVEVWFNYQAINCDSNTLEETVKVAADTLFATHQVLDFTLFSVQNFTSIEPFGYLGLDVRDAQLGERIYIPQHGYGSPKQIAIESDMNASGLCEVDDLHVDKYAPDTDIGYFCDSVGGSSGSPVLAGSSGRVIALHHFGGCVNSGVKMSLIWPQVSEHFGGVVPAGSGTEPTQNNPPLPAISFTCNELSCNFSGAGSSDEDGYIVSYLWEFGDGSSGSGVQPGHDYSAPGSYSVRLVVEDDEGATASVERLVNTSVHNETPMAAYSFSCDAMLCTFDAGLSSDSDGQIVTYAWTFGDNFGTQGSNPVVQHEFAQDGSYLVTLTVWDDQDASSQSQSMITVTSPVFSPVIDLSVNLRKTKGQKTADLVWSGATAAKVDILRDGQLLVNTNNDGSYTDSMLVKRTRSVRYMVCQTGPDICSEEINVKF